MNEKSWSACAWAVVASIQHEVEASRLDSLNTCFSRSQTFALCSVMEKHEEYFRLTNVSGELCSKQLRSGVRSRKMMAGRLAGLQM